MLCPHCQNENRDYAKFCDQCGAPLTDIEADATADDDALDGSTDGNSENGNAEDDELAEEGDDAGKHDEPEDERALSAIPLDDITIIADDEEADGETTAEITDDASEDDASVEEGTPSCESADESSQSADTPSSADPTECIEADLAGFDRQAEDYGERAANGNWHHDQTAFHDGETMHMPRIENDQTQQGNDNPISSQSEKRGGKARKAAVIAIALIALAAAIAAFSTYQMEMWGGKIVPDTAGMTEADARSVLVSKGFTVRSEQVKSDDTEGIVLIMDPSAGSRLDEGSEVVIHITAARTIPNIVGRTRAAAEKDLAEAGYVHVNFVEETSDKTKGTVIAVKPDEGEEVKSTEEITVTIAIPRTVPDVTGMGADEAIATIQDAGLTCDIAYYDAPDSAENTVVSTDPAAGTEVEEGAYIVINVAKARSQKLEEAAMEHLSEGTTVVLGNTSYTIVSLISATYQGDNTVAFSAIARPNIGLSWIPGLEKDPVEISGTVVFNENDELVGVS